MRADKKKLELAMARACIAPAEIPERAGLLRPTANNVLNGKSVRPDTLGKVARALGVDPLDIILEEGRPWMRRLYWQGY